MVVPQIQYLYSKPSSNVQSSISSHCIHENLYLMHFMNANNTIFSIHSHMLLVFMEISFLFFSIYGNSRHSPLFSWTFASFPSLHETKSTSLYLTSTKIRCLSKKTNSVQPTKIIFLSSFANYFLFYLSV